MADIRDRWASSVLRDKRISDGCARTAWAIREYANRAGRCTVGLTALARDTDRAKRTIERHMIALSQLGYLTRTLGAGQTTQGGTTSLTELRIPAEAPTPRSVLQVPTARSAPPTVQPPSTGRRVPKVPTELCRPNHGTNRTSVPASADGRAGAHDTNADMRNRYPNLGCWEDDDDAE